MVATVICQRHDAHTAIVTLNRAEKRNALSIELMESLCIELESLESDPDCRVVILCGAGPVFCAGLDLLEAADRAVAKHSAGWVAKTLSDLSGSPLVTIAAAHGGAFAGGAGLMAACDLVVASDDLKIGFPEVRRGLVPAIVTNVLRHRLRDSELRELFLLAEPIDATRALGMGLVQRVVPADQRLDQALKLAQTICQGGPEAVRQTKRLIRQVCSLSGPESLDTLLELHSQARNSSEADEGLAAFRQRRSPQW